MKRRRHTASGRVKTVSFGKTPTIAVSQQTCNFHVMLPLMWNLTALLGAFTTLVLIGMAPAQPAATPATQPTTKPTIYLVGDSTVRNGSRGQQGWGEVIAPYFDPAKVTIDNRARGGRSSRSFIREGLWDAILEQLKPGDYVLIQMGHNDGGPLSGDNRERGSIRGIGEETQDVTLVLDNNKPETVHTYGWYLRKYIADARAKGAKPILCSPVAHCPRNNDDPIQPGREQWGYVEWSEQVAKQTDTPFIDLNRLIWTKWVGMRPSEVKAKYFTEADWTHTSPAGAALNAGCVVEGIKSLHEPALIDLLTNDVE